ncbi:MAG: glycosyltransferase family 39 protein [Planctomycetota bacterium]
MEPSGKRLFWTLVCLTVAAGLLRMPLLDRSIWFDEACMSSQRIGTLPQMLATLYRDIHPPLFVACMHAWNRLFGDGEIAMRMPALLTGLACIPLTYWVGHLLVGRRAALWAAILLALSPVHTWYCAEARLYAPMVFCTLLGFGTFLRLMQPNRTSKRRRLLFWGHVANVAVMLMLHYYLAVVVLVQLLLAPVLTRGFRRRSTRIVLVHGIGLALLAAFVLIKRALGQFETSQTYLGELTPAKLGTFLCNWTWTGNTMQTAEASWIVTLGRSYELLGVGAMALGLVAIARYTRTRAAGWLVPVAILMLPAFLFACAAIGLQSTYLERTLIPALPFVLLLAAAGICLLPKPLRLVAGAGNVLLAAGAMLALYDGYSERWTLYKPHPDWRSAAQWLGNELEAEAAGRPVYTSMPNPRSLSYYEPRIQYAKNLKSTISPERIGKQVTDRLGPWFGRIAQAQFAEFDRYNAELLANASLVVYRSKPDPGKLTRPASAPDDIAYIVRNHWHPNVDIDDSVERLLADPRVQTIEAATFPGVTVSKVRIARD